MLPLVFLPTCIPALGWVRPLVRQNLDGVTKGECEADRAVHCLCCRRHGSLRHVKEAARRGGQGGSACRKTVHEDLRGVDLYLRGAVPTNTRPYNRIKTLTRFQA